MFRLGLNKRTQVFVIIETASTAIKMYTNVVNGSSVSVLVRDKISMIAISLRVKYIILNIIIMDELSYIC